MAQQENTLGAPTEGLGQNVTFAFDARSGIPQLNIPSAGSTRMGVQTGQQAGVQLARPQMDPVRSATVDLLMKAGDSVLNKKLEQARLTKYVEGMQRAMAGEAVQDIATEQPWYTQLFGDAAVVEGARAYAQHANVTNAVGKLEEALPELRKMPAAEASRFLAQSVQTSMTGDKATDVAVLQSYSKLLPGFMRRQAKEHYAWKQEQAVTAQSSAIGAMASHFERAAGAQANGMTNDEEYLAMQDQLLQLSRPPAGQPEEGWQKMMAGTLGGMAARGELHSLKAFKNAGVLQSLQPEQASQVEAAIMRAESKALPKMTGRYAADMAVLMTDATMGPAAGSGGTAALEKRIDALNEQAKKEFGTSYGPISPDEKVALLKGSLTALARAEEAASAKRLQVIPEEKDAAAQNEVLAALQGARSIARLKLQRGITDDHINGALLNVYSAAKTPDNRAAVLHRADTLGHGVIPQLRDELEGAVSASISDKGVDASTLGPVYGQWLAMHQRDPALAARYFGRHAGQMAMFDRGMKTHGNIVAAARTAFGDKPPKGQLDKAALKEAAGAVNDAYNSGMPSWAIGLRRLPLKDGQADQFVQLVGRDVEELTTQFGNATSASKVAVDAALRNGSMELLGGYAISSIPGAKSLASYLTDPSGYSGNKNDKRTPFGQGSDMLDDLLEKAIDLKLHGPRGIIPPTGLIQRKADTVRVMRVGDVNGVPQLIIMAASGSDTFHAEVSGDELFKLKDELIAEQKARPGLSTRLDQQQARGEAARRAQERADTEARIKAGLNR